MPIVRDEIRQELLDAPCKECEHRIHEKDQLIISFYRGEFVVFHEDCFDKFIQENVWSHYGTKTN